MGLISEEVEVLLQGINIKYYEDLGYIIPRVEHKWGITVSPGTKIKVKVEDLPKESHVMVEVKCDYCGENCYKQYRDYLIQRKTIPKDSCDKCKYIKQKQTNLDRYGVEYSLQNNDVRNKIKNTNLERYGYECVSKNEDIKNKKKQTFLNKYGVSNPFQNHEIKEKIKVINLNKYGEEHPMKVKDIYNKLINTNLKKYGMEYYSQTEECKERIKNTCLDKYGKENYMQTEEFREKSKKYNQDNYGVEYYSMTDEFREKFKETSLLNWGVEHPLQNKEIQRKVRNTLYKNGTTPTSSQQLEIYNQLKDNNYNVELNYPVSNCSLDIALFINDIKIDIEYDCWYWHKNKQKDIRRDKYLESQGWKVFRIKSAYKIPSLEQLIEQIKKLLDNKNRYYTHIILDDWKEKENILSKSVVI